MKEESPTSKEMAIAANKKLGRILRKDCCPPNKGCNRKNGWKKHKGDKPKYKDKR